jgi:purine-binding chemotaxis protein CheW
MKKPKDIPARLRKLEEEMRALRGALQQEREVALGALADPVEVLIGSVADQWVAFPLSAVREVLPRVLLQDVPEAPDYLAGYLNWRGTPVPVIDPAARWGAAPMPVRLEDRIVVFSSGAGPRAMLLSQVEQITRVSRSELGRMPDEIPAAPYALAMWYSADRNVLLIAPERLVDPAELARYETA